MIHNKILITFLLLTRTIFLYNFKNELVTGCCIEDKLFPKTNSLLDDRAQPLADIKEFALKIQV